MKNTVFKLLLENELKFLKNLHEFIRRATLYPRALAKYLGNGQAGKIKLLDNYVDHTQYALILDGGSGEYWTGTYLTLHCKNLWYKWDSFFIVFSM